MKADPIPHCPPDKLIFITKDKADTTSSVKESWDPLLGSCYLSYILHPCLKVTLYLRLLPLVTMLWWFVCAPVPLGSLRNSGRSLLSEGREK